MDFNDILKKLQEKQLKEGFAQFGDVEKAKEKIDSKSSKPGILSKIFGKKIIDNAEDAKKYYEKEGHVPNGWIRNIHGEFSKKRN